MTAKKPITIAYGDGIGPEIMEATLHILEAASAPLTYEPVVIGEQVYRRGFPSGIEEETWESLRRTKVFLKGPVTTPLGGGFRSLNVTIRSGLGLYANVRPCVAYAPFIETLHPGMDVVIIRENEEDLYGGIEHRQTDDVVQCLKLITRPGCEKIIRYAFEYARRHGREKVTCFTKDNIMKLTDGLFHRVFNEIAVEYPEIKADHLIIDIGTARLADTPEIFSVIVTPNLYGDIISDVAAQVAGSVGFAGSANIGEHGAMFEAIHGSAPTIAGQNIANPSGLLLAAVMMLVHIGQNEIAERVQNAWLRTIEEGIHTADIYRAETSKQKVGTREFGQAVVDRLGQSPQILKAVHYQAKDRLAQPTQYEKRKPCLKELVGVDVFLQEGTITPDELAQALKQVETDGLTLQMITNRGAKVWPEGLPETFCIDHWHCRFMAEGKVEHGRVLNLLQRIASAGFDFTKIENLYTYDGEPGYALAQ